MKRLRITENTWDQVQTYLDHPSERMAFFAATVTDGTDATAGDWSVVEVMYLDDDHDYSYQGWAGVELADHIRPQTLKWATEHEAALVEIHSHGPGAGATSFSTTDLRGLTEITPSLLWRLGSHPYAAIVVGGRHDHDSLTWTAKETPPAPITELIIGTSTTRPTGRALASLTALKKETP